MDPNGPLDVHGRVVCDRALAKGTPLGPLGPLVSKGSSPGGLDALAAIAAKAKDNYPDVDKSTTLPVSTRLYNDYANIYTLKQLLIVPIILAYLSLSNAIK